MLKDAIASPARSYEPTGYGGAEIDAIGVAVSKLRTMRMLAIMRYCKPWMINAINAELGRQYDTDTWLYHLRQALEELEAEMKPKRKLIEFSENCG